MQLSVVTTLYQSADHIEEFHARAGAAAARVTNDYEIIFVNDGSPDASLEKAIALLQKDARVRVVDLSRNFGHHKAMMTGLAYSRGELVFLVESDLEEAPELLQTFHDRMRTAGADVVYGVQRVRRGGLVERVSGWLFFTIFNLLSDHPIPSNVTTVRLMTRRYVAALVSHHEREMVIAGLWEIAGFDQVPVEITKPRRTRTTYSTRRKLSILVNAITSFSSKPLYVIFYLGLGVAAAATAAAIYLVIRRVFFGVLLAGWPSLIVSVWLFGGLTLFGLGVIGIYLSKIFIETKQRPYTIVRSVHERVADRDAT
jgi:putative glycosyltransferase